ncbi:MAG: twin-arginine translocase TatA/TatE family subunit [Rhodanobacteraceae bacterium]
MGFDSIWHWLLLLVIVLVIFGTGKLTKLGPDLGNAVRGFKKALQGEEDDKSKTAADGEKLQADPPPAAESVNAKQEQHDSAESK